MDIRAVNYRGHVYSIYDLRSYFQSNLKMLNEENFRDFNDPDWPIYTRTNDSASASYLPGGSTNRSSCPMDVRLPAKSRIPSWAAVSPLARVPAWTTA